MCTSDKLCEVRQCRWICVTEFGEITIYAFIIIFFINGFIEISKCLIRIGFVEFPCYDEVKSVMVFEPELYKVYEMRGLT